MTNEFKRLMREQLQKSLKKISDFSQEPIPKKGWIKAVRNILGISSSVLAKKLGCTRPNISYIEQSELKGIISLDTLQEVAKAMDCKLVYCLVPLESFDKILENQARLIAKKRINVVNHSMKLEQQGLTQDQLQQQEDSLVRELLQEDPKKLWNDI